MSGAMERFYQEARKQAKLEVALELIKKVRIHLKISQSVQGLVSKK